MATTIGHLALKISAHTGPLSKDMANAEKITDKSGKKMADNIGKGGSAWGSFFRGAFALAAVKKFIGFMRQGVEELHKVGDPAAQAATEQIQRIDDSIGKITAALAKTILPIFSRVADAIGNATDHLMLLLDAVKNTKLGRLLGLNADELKIGDKVLDAMNEKTLEKRHKAAQDAAMKRITDRVELEKKYVDVLFDAQSAALKFGNEVNKIKADFAGAGIFAGDPERLEKMNKLIDIQGDKLQAAFGLSINLTPLEEYEQKIRDIHELISNVPKKAPQFGRMAEQAFKAMLDGMGLALEIDPFDKWLESWNNLQSVMFQGDAGRKMRDQLEKQLGGGLDEMFGMQKGPMDEYTSKLAQLDQLRANGIINEEKYITLLGRQRQILAEQTELVEKINRDPPELKLRGSNEALGTIQAFRAKPQEAKKGPDIAKVLEAGQKKAEAQRQELIRLGKQKPQVVGR